MKPESHFDQKIMELLDHPDFVQKEIQNVSPFTKVLQVLTAGFILVFFTFDTGIVSDIFLPCLGNIFIFIGFYMLHKENTHFRICYSLSSILLIIFIMTTLMDATPYRFILIYTTEISILLKITLFAFYTLGLKKSFQFYIPEMTYTLICYVFTILITYGFATYAPNNIFALILCTVLYILMLFFLHKTRKKLEYEGYQMKSVLFTLSTRLFLCLLFTTLFYIISIIFLTYHFTTKDYQTYTPITPVYNQKERKTLADKGLDTSYIKDLHEDDMLSLLNVDQFATFQEILGNDEVNLAIHFGYANKNTIHILATYEILDIEKYQRGLQAQFIPSDTSIDYTLTLQSNYLMYDSHGVTYETHNPNAFSPANGQRYRGYRYYILQMDSDKTGDFQLVYFADKDQLRYPYQSFEIPQLQSNYAFNITDSITSHMVLQYSLTARIDINFHQLLLEEH